MIETLLKLPFSAFISLGRLVWPRRAVRLECWFGHQPNEDGIGNYLAFWIKIINVSQHGIYFDRVEAKDLSGETFYPLVYSVLSNQEIPPRRNIVALIPCGHIAGGCSEISVVDATEARYRLRGRKLKRAISALEHEMARLTALGVSVQRTQRKDLSEL